MLCGQIVKPYPPVDDLLRPILRVAMPRAAGNAPQPQPQTPSPTS